jgi:hypothetical protein
VVAVAEWKNRVDIELLSAGRDTFWAVLLQSSLPGLLRGSLIERQPLVGSQST